MGGALCITVYRELPYSVANRLPDMQRNKFGPLLSHFFGVVVLAIPQSVLGQSGRRKPCTPTCAEVKFRR